MERDKDDEDEGEEKRDDRVFRPTVEIISTSWLVKADHDCYIQFMERQAGSMSPEDFLELVEDAEAHGVDVELIAEVVLAFTFKTRIK